MSDELKEKIKHVMSRRYDAATRFLNLTQFHLDEGKMNTMTFIKNDR